MDEVGLPIIPREILRNRKLLVRINHSWECRIPAVPSPTGDLRQWVRGIRSTTEARESGACSTEAGDCYSKVKYYCPAGLSFSPRRVLLCMDPSVCLGPDSFRFAVTRPALGYSASCASLWPVIVRLLCSPAHTYKPHPAQMSPGAEDPTAALAFALQQQIGRAHV